MDISASEAIERLRQLASQADEVSVMQRAIAAHLDQIKTGLMALSDSGFSPGRMPSTIMLTSEAYEKATENLSRTLQIAEGIGAMI